MFEDIEIIDAYTRADAIRDGVLSDVTGVVARHRYLCPVAITATVLHLVDACTSLQRTTHVAHCLVCLRIAVNT